LACVTHQANDDNSAATELAGRILAQRDTHYIIDPILEQWSNRSGPPMFEYEAGEWGPAESNEWIRRFGHAWFDVCPILA
jgi:hypothetical protein